MRADVERALRSIHHQDAKQLLKAAFRQCFEAIPESEEILAALPVVFDHNRGPLIITQRQLIFLSRRGSRLTAPLADVGHVWYSTSGMLRPVPFELHVDLGSSEVVFGFGSTRAASVNFFVETLEQTRDGGGRASTNPHQPSPAVPSAPGAGDDERIGAELATMSGDDVAITATWMQNHFNEGNYGEIYGRRLTLGYASCPRGTSPDVWYWLNAYAVVAALRLGLLELGDDPFATMCATQARQALDPRDQSQVAAMNEIARGLSQT